MNQKIRELVVQANEYTDNLMKLSGDNHPNWMTIRDEKLVELVVKDCYVALFPALRDMISRGQAYDMIRKHFGVEE